MTEKTEIMPADIMPMAEYKKVRTEKRRGLAPAKQKRRIAIGPDAHFYFESYDTMWLQIHEMLYIEQGGEDQVADELQAYNPLIPKGSELVATLMFEIDQPQRRKALLGQLGGVEERVVMYVQGQKIAAQAEQDVDRTNAEGKASSIQFLHFPLDTAAKSAFLQLGAEVMLEITHPAYAHRVRLSEENRQELARDLR